MKKQELDLSKAHVDQFKSDPKSYSGSKLALTEAGWATVSEDGTIVEVLDAFPASQDDIFQQLISRNEVESTAILDETLLINPTDIGLNDGDPLNDSSDKNGELTLGGPAPTPDPLSAVISTVTGTSDPVDDEGTDTVGIKWKAAQVTEIEIAVVPTGGSGSFSYDWDISYPSVDNGNYQDLKTTSFPNVEITKSQIESALGQPLSAAEDDFTIKGTIIDSNDPAITYEVFVIVDYSSAPV